MKWIGRIVAVLCIWLAIDMFDSRNFIQAAISVILFLAGVSTLTSEFETDFWQKATKVCSRTALVITIILLVKIFILDRFLFVG